jgi:hypothetical protein
MKSKLQKQRHQMKLIHLILKNLTEIYKGSKVLRIARLLKNPEASLDHLLS